MTLNELLTQLAQRDVQLWVKDEQLRIRARKGVLTPEIRHALDASNAELLAFILGKDQEDPLPAPQSSTGQPSAPSPVTRPIDFSLLYFSSNEAEFSQDKYKLFLDSARFADTHGFCAVWIPERHFHAFGGIYPNPAVLGAALAVSTQRIRIRAGSVVLPLHQPIRVAEEWSVVDNLSQGRVDLAFACGWNPNDFVLAPHAYPNRVEHLWQGIETVQRLWQGEEITLPNGVGKEFKFKIYPLPKQPTLPIWITCSGGAERFEQAGALGANVLTALLFQPIEELAEKISRYRTARAQHGFDPERGHVTVMLHTHVGDNLEAVRARVREPFLAYLKSSVNLWKSESQRLDQLSAEAQEELLAYGFERYYQTSALFGTPQSCLGMIQQLRAAGVDEVACLIDFGLEPDVVLAGLSSLQELQDASSVSVKKNPAPTATS